jgi:PAS domain S-box-containing protein
MLLSPQDKVKTFDKLWEHSLIGLCFVSAEGKFLKVNPAICSLLEYTEYELLGRSFAELTIPSDIQADNAEAKKVELGKKTEYIMHKKYITKTNRIIGITLKVTRMEDDEHRFIYFLSQIGPSTRLKAFETEVDLLANGPAMDLGRFISINKKWLIPLSVPVIAGLFKFCLEIYHYLRTVGAIGGL